MLCDCMLLKHNNHVSIRNVSTEKHYNTVYNANVLQSTDCTSKRHNLSHVSDRNQPCVILRRVPDYMCRTLPLAARISTCTPLAHSQSYSYFQNECVKKKLK